MNVTIPECRRVLRQSLVPFPHRACRLWANCLLSQPQRIQRVLVPIQRKFPTVLLYIIHRHNGRNSQRETVSVLDVICYARGIWAASSAEWRSRSIYQVLTERFSLSDGSTTAACVTGNRHYCGGTYQGIIKQLDYIKGMGFTAVGTKGPNEPSSAIVLMRD
jgi:hypothetical protein